MSLELGEDIIRCVQEYPGHKYYNVINIFKSKVTAFHQVMKRRIPKNPRKLTAANVLYCQLVILLTIFKDI